MKKFLSFGVLAIAISAVLSGCSKSTDLYDEETAAKLQHEQMVAELKKAYNDAFAKEFGTIDPNNAWGFDKTRGAFTRVASNYESSDYWIIPENLWNGITNKEGWNANAVANGFKEDVSQSYTIDNFSFDNYFIQHVDKYKPASCYLQAWNSKYGRWENVDHFKDGDNTGSGNSFSSNSDDNFYFKNNPNSTAQITTLMKDMGGQPCDQADENGSNDSKNKLFRLVKGTNDYDYNYYLGWVENEHKSPNKVFNEPVLVFKLGRDKNNNGNGNNPFWVMRLGVAQPSSEKVMAEGRILCEDMGANDFDFNDVVFDAKIMGDGKIIITVLAHGGMLDIYIDGEKVTLPQMTNTGLKSANTQEIIIPAGEGGKPKYEDINLIPVQVDPNGDAKDKYDLNAVKGTAPQKVCVPIGISWPDEYVGISRAYTPFESYVSIHTMDDWMFTVNSDLVDRNMSNND